MSVLWRDFARNVTTRSAAMNAAGLTQNPFAGSFIRPMARREALATGLTYAGALAASGLLLHEAANAAEAPAAAGGDGAKQFITDLANKAIAVMVDKQLSDADRATMFQALFVSSFDLPAIGQRVLGRYWRTASPEQRDQFLKLFEQQEVLVWAGRFKSYNGQKLVVEGAEQGEGGSWQVKSHIDQRSGSPIPLEWTVAESGNVWRINDIIVEGASMSLTLRQDFAAVLDSNGGKVEGLLAAMQKKISQLRGTG